MPETPKVSGAPEPPRIVVRVAADRLTAFVTIRPGAAIGEKELRSALEAAQVRSGIDVGTFARLALGLTDPKFAVDRPEIVARGAPAQEGEDGRFEPNFPEGIQPGHVREDGTVDFHDRELLKPVACGDVLGHIRPARAGISGHLVDGTASPAKATREATIALGPGVERDADGVVRAKRAGVLDSKRGQSLDVVDQHLHKGAVDIRSGNLLMLGSIVVQGDVQRSFKVQASGDVEIRGNVEGGSVQAGGNVSVKYGVRGAEGGLVQADGNVSIHHAEMANVQAGLLLQLGESVHSQLAAGRIEVAGKLRGGRANAEFSIVVREVGSPQGLDTELAVAEPLEPAVEGALRALEREKALRVAKAGLRGKPGERAKGGKLGRTQAELGAAETQRLAAREKRRETLAQVAFVQVGVAHTGVTLHIAGHKLLLETELRASRISLDPQTRALRTDKIGR